MPYLEPTYLRYIYDGLLKGSIHPENAAELPDGLIGLYEEAFDERTSVVERQKLLQRFAICALLKKEVSASFISEILGETEDDIQEFISTSVDEALQSFNVSKEFKEMVIEKAEII